MQKNNAANNLQLKEVVSDEAKPGGGSSYVQEWRRERLTELRL